MLNFIGSGSANSYYLSNQLGSITRLTNSSGASTGRYQYLPYGGLLSSSTPVTGNPFTFTGREDDGTGLMYYRARYYDPSLQVFISQDPMDDNQRYVGGNPILGIDPLGLDPNLNFIPHGTNASDSNKMIYNSAQKYVLNSTDWWGFQPYTVVAHGNPDIMTHSNTQAIFPKELAKIILSDSNYTKGHAVQLFGCRTGEGDNSFAQQLANLLQAPVIAPNKQVWWGPNGPEEVMGKKAGPKPKTYVKDPTKPGSYVIFFPQH